MKRTILTAVSLLILFVLPPHLSAGPQSWQQAQKIAERIGCWAKNSVAPMTPGNVFLKMGDKETVVPLKLTNWGDTEVTSISYTFYYTDKQVSEGPFVLNFDQPLKNGETREVKIPIKPGQKLGKEELLFNITQVNGQYNEASAGYAYLTCWGVNKYSVIRDRSKIEIAAVLFNTKTGKIENAARCSVRNHGTTGIRPNLVQEQKKKEGIYDMQGRKVNGKPTPGIYIVNGKKTVIR